MLVLAHLKTTSPGQRHHPLLLDQRGLRVVQLDLDPLAGGQRDELDAGDGRARRDERDETENERLREGRSKRHDVVLRECS
jgi:hypothetical protein